MQNALSAPQVGGIVRLTRFILITSFVVEITGALLLLPVFVPKYGIIGIWIALLQSDTEVIESSVYVNGA